jgi:hypothetical protein
MCLVCKHVNPVFPQKDEIEIDLTLVHGLAQKNKKEHE